MVLEHEVDSLPNKQSGNVYSKAQARYILRNLFAKSIFVVHK